MSAYDKVVQVVTNDNTEVKPPQEEQSKKHIWVFENIVIFLKFVGSLLELMTYI